MSVKILTEEDVKKILAKIEWEVESADPVIDSVIFHPDGYYALIFGGFEFSIGYREQYTFAVRAAEEDRVVAQICDSSYPALEKIHSLIRGRYFYLNTGRAQQRQREQDQEDEELVRKLNSLLEE